MNNRVKDMENHGYTVGRWKEDDMVRTKFKVANLKVKDETSL